MTYTDFIAFLRDVYQRAFARYPVQSELKYWYSKYKNKEITTRQIARDFAANTPPQQDGYWYANDYDKTITDTLASAEDVSVWSDELASKVSDWSTLYEYGKNRQVLLHPFIELFKGKRVLEIGAGTGTITRFLGENSKVVTSLEPSPERYQSLCQRTRDLTNVNCLNEGIEFLVDDQAEYDIVVVVGVLEYAGVIFKDLDSSISPEDRFVSLAKSKLAKDGLLIVAIENKMGLRYLTPNREDHTSFYSESIHDFPNSTGIKTFTRRELGALLKRAGLSHQQFYYPHPDYKTPTLVYGDSVEKFGNAAASMIFSDYSLEYRGSQLRMVDELALIRLLNGQGLLGEFANSFLVFAGAEKVEVPELVLERYTLARKREFMHKLELNSEGTITKKRLYGGQIIDTSKMHDSVPLSHELRLAMLADDHYQAFVSTLQQLCQYIFKAKKSSITPELHIDNLMRVNGELLHYDAEIPEEARVPFSKEEVLLRSLLSISNYPRLYVHYDGVTVREFIADMFRHLTKSKLSAASLDKFIGKEIRYTSRLTYYPKEYIESNLNKHLSTVITNRHYLTDVLDTKRIEDIVEWATSAQ